MNKITEVQIVLIKPQNGLIGFAGFVYDNQFYLGSIGIHTRVDGLGYRLTYPNKIGSNRNLDIYHPVNRNISEDIEQAIFAKLKEVMEKCNDRHNSNTIGTARY